MSYAEAGLHRALHMIRSWQAVLHGSMAKGDPHHYVALLYATEDIPEFLVDCICAFQACKPPSLVGVNIQIQAFFHMPECQQHLCD